MTVSIISFQAAFALLVLLPFAVALPYDQQTSHPKPSPPSYPQPAPYQPQQPAYPQPPAPAPAPAYPQPQQPSYPQPPQYQQPAYPQPSYEKPKHNCSVEDVVEIGEVCTPTLQTSCENVNIPIKVIVDGEYCYEAVSTICTETSQTIDNEVCTFTYNKKDESTTGRTVNVNFEKKSNVQMVTVCQPQPSYGYGYQQSYGQQQGYGQQQYCKEVAQETSFNVPIVTPVDVPVHVSYPEAVRACVNKPITLPRINCETKSEKKCVPQPEIKEESVAVEKCSVRLGQPNCQKVELTLPKQICKEIVYGYAEDKPQAQPEPQYQPQQPAAPQYKPQPEPQYKPSRSHSSLLTLSHPTTLRLPTLKCMVPIT